MAVAFGVLLYKAFVFWVIFASPALLPGFFNHEAYTANFHWPQGKSPTMEERFKTWDGQHYLFLSHFGYQAGSPSAAFYPLWPLCIRAAAVVLGGNHLLAGLLLANLFSCAAIVALHRLIEEDHGRDIADLSVSLFLAYPGALFYSFVYSESLFLLLVVILFLAAKRQKVLLCCVAGFLLPLTRAVGLFCLAPLLLQERERGRGCLASWTAGAFVIGWASYFGIMFLATGNILEGFHAQRHYLACASLEKLLDPVGFIRSLTAPLAIHGFLNSAIDRTFFCLLLGCLVPLYRTNKAYFLYAALLGVVPAVTNSFMSYTRYLAVVFPVFVVAARYLALPQRGYLRFVTLACLFGLQVIFLLRHVNNHWVG